MDIAQTDLQPKQKIDGRKKRPKAPKEELLARKRERYHEKKEQERELARIRMKKLRDADKEVDPEDDDAVVAVKKRHDRKIATQRRYLERKRERA